MEPKRVPPSLRTKSRYIIFEAITESQVDFDYVSKSVWNAVSEFLGELGSSEVRLWLVKNLYNNERQVGVIKCSHDRVEQVRTALALVRSVGESRAIMRILGVTGTIKSAQLKYLEAGRG